MTRPRLGVTFTPLKPKRPVVDLHVPNRVDRVMRQGGGDLVRERRTYPPARPWKSRTPKSGPRKGGRRTGNLGRNWNVRFGRGFFEVWNPVAYAGYVQGYRRRVKGDKRTRQTKVMKARGWRSFDADNARLKRTLGPGLRRAFKQSRR